MNRKLEGGLTKFFIENNVKVVQRKKLLNYLKKKSYHRYKRIIEELKL